MVTIEMLKKHLRLPVDYTDEDDILQVYLNAAERYVLSIVPTASPDNPIYHVIVLALASEMYERRTMSVEKLDVSPIISRLLLSLQLN